MVQWLENEGGYRWFDPFGNPKKIFCILQNVEFIVLTGTLDIAPDDKPQPVVIFVSNGSGTDNDETVS